MNLTPAAFLSHCTVRVEATFQDGSGTGTGFFFEFAKAGGQHIPALVTNRHVIEGALEGRFRVTRKSPTGEADLSKHSEFYFQSKFDERWIRHPNPKIDLVVLPIGPLLAQIPEEVFFTTLDASWIPTIEEVEDYIGLEAVTMVGYPNGIWDTVNNLPIFRRGVLATEYRHNWRGEREFLIDCACFPGSSGSPVFLLDTAGYATKSNIALGGRVKFLGVLYKGFQHTVEGKIVVVDVPVQNRPVPVSTIPNNLGIIIKSEVLSEFDEPLMKIAQGNS